MSDVFKKLNLRHHDGILVLNPSESFEPELALLEGDAIVWFVYSKARSPNYSYQFNRVMTRTKQRRLTG